jgi:hypothetical protein
LPIRRAAIFVEPGGHSSVLSAETFRRNGDADVDWKTPFGPRDQRVRIARHRQRRPTRQNSAGMSWRFGWL